MKGELGYAWKPGSGFLNAAFWSTWIHFCHFVHRSVPTTSWWQVEENLSVDRAHLRIIHKVLDLSSTPSTMTNESYDPEGWRPRNLPTNTNSIFHDKVSSVPLETYFDPKRCSSFFQAAFSNRVVFPIVIGDTKGLPNSTNWSMPPRRIPKWFVFESMPQKESDANGGVEFSQAAQ